MIDSYKKEVLNQLIYTVGFSLFVVIMDFFSAEYIFWSSLIIMIVGHFLYTIFYQLLIVDVAIENDLITIVHFSIVFGKEELKIKTVDMLELKSKNANSIKFVTSGTNGPIEKSFYSNVKPWDELNRKLTEIKKLLPKH